MTPAEAAKVLSVAAVFDGRIRPASAEDATAKAVAWAAALHPTLPGPVAESLVVAHYAESTDVVMPAHVNTRWRAQRRTIAEAMAAAEVTASRDRRPMPEGLRAAFRQIGRS